MPCESYTVLKMSKQGPWYPQILWCCPTFWLHWQKVQEFWKEGQRTRSPLLVSILSHHRTEICPRKFPSWWTWNSGDINTPFSSPIWGARPRTFTVNSSLLRVQRLTGPDTTCTTLQPWLIKERKLDQWQEETGELLSRPSLPASFCWKREGLLGNLQVAET